MRMLPRFALPALPIVLLLQAACAVEEPYPGGPKPPVPILSSEEVIKVLLAGVSEDAVIETLRKAGIRARPTTAEIQALRFVGASDRLLAMLFAADLAPPDRRAGPRFDGHPLPPLPGCWPVDAWLWLEGTLKAFPRPAPPIEAEP